MNKKLNILQRKRSQTLNNNIKANYVNLSKRNFNTDEDQILKKGIKFVAEAKLNIQGYIAEIEDAIQKINKNEQEITRTVIFNKNYWKWQITRNGNIKNLPQSDYKTNKLIRQLKNDKDIVIIDSDKTKKLII